MGIQKLRFLRIMDSVQPFVNWVPRPFLGQEDVFFCDSENCVKEVTIISKGNDKNNEHFLDFTEMRFGDGRNGKTKIYNLPIPSADFQTKTEKDLVFQSLRFPFIKL